MISVRIKGLDLLLTDVIGIDRDEKRVELFRAGVEKPEIVSFLDEKTALEAYEKIYVKLLESDTVIV